MKKLLIIFILFIKVCISFAQETEDETDLELKRPLGFSTKGLYLSGGCMLTGIRYPTASHDSIQHLRLHNAYFYQLYLEFKYNLAVTIEYSITSEINNENWRNANHTMIGFIGHFPCYRSYKHKGIYIESGYALANLKGYHSFSNNSVPEFFYNQNSLKMLNGIGYEYKFKWVQVFTLTRFKIPLYNLFPRSIYSDNAPIITADFIAGLKLKIPGIIKKTKQHYHWF